MRENNNKQGTKPCKNNKSKDTANYFATFPKVDKHFYNISNGLSDRLIRIFEYICSSRMRFRNELSICNRTISAELKISESTFRKYLAEMQYRNMLYKNPNKDKGFRFLVNPLLKFKGSHEQHLRLISTVGSYHMLMIDYSPIDELKERIKVEKEISKYSELFIQIEIDKKLEKSKAIERKRKEKEEFEIQKLKEEMEELENPFE